MRSYHFYSLSLVLTKIMGHRWMLEPHLMFALTNCDRDIFWERARLLVTKWRACGAQVDSNFSTPLLQALEDAMNLDSDVKDVQPLMVSIYFVWSMLHFNGRAFWHAYSGTVQNESGNIIINSSMLMFYYPHNGRFTMLAMPSSSMHAACSMHCPTLHRQIHHMTHVTSLRFKMFIYFLI